MCKLMFYTKFEKKGIPNTLRVCQILLASFCIYGSASNCLISCLLHFIFQIQCMISHLSASAEISIRNDHSPSLLSTYQYRTVSLKPSSMSLSLWRFPTKALEMGSLLFTSLNPLIFLFITAHETHHCN